jgi:DNA primase
MVYDIDTIKRRNPIEAVVAGHGVQLRRSGLHLSGRCPFHDDGHPSFVVYPETASFHCFGCRISGDVIDFIRRADGLSFREALERLSDGSPPSPRRDRVPEERLSLDDRMILTAACGVYHETLLQMPKVLGYLEERGIGLTLIRRCRLGYSDGRSLRQYLQRRRMSLKRASQMGLLWRDGGETMAGRVVIPELRGGQCIWMVGRALDDARQPKYRGLSLPKPILGYERVRGRPRVFVTEGAFDYLTGMGWGLSVCALLGTQVRAERLAFLQRTRRVLIVFDSDEPGREAASDLARRLGSRARIVELPDGVKDLNDLGRRPDGRATFFRLVGDIERERNEPQEADEDVAEAQQA